MIYVKGCFAYDLSYEFYGGILTFLSFSHFEYIFVHSVRVCSNITDLHAAAQLSQHHLLKRLSHCVFLAALLKVN